MTFNPLQEKGRSLEQQFRSWEEMNLAPYGKSEIHPFSRARIILMNGIEMEAALFSHGFVRQSDNPEIREKLTILRRIEQQQQKMINWLIPPEESVLETAMGYEQTEIDLTAWIARTESNSYVKAVMNYGLLDDFDHLYRLANLYDLTEQGDGEKIVGDLTEILPGRPTADQHVHPLDTLRAAVKFDRSDILTRLHLLTLFSTEQQTLNFYSGAGNRISSSLGRSLFQEIAMAEEQHVTFYECLIDPGRSWLERLLVHEYNECYLYYCCMESEGDSRIKWVWQQFLEDEIEHLKVASFLIQEVEGRDPMEILPDHFPKLTILDSNKEYIRSVLAEQVDLTTIREQFLSMSKVDAGSFLLTYQNAVNGKGLVPSLQVIAESIRRNGEDFRNEQRGPHPVESMRDRNIVQRVIKYRNE